MVRQVEQKKKKSGKLNQLSIKAQVVINLDYGTRVPRILPPCSTLGSA